MPYVEYAKAIYELSLEEKSLDATYETLKALDESFNDNNDFIYLLQNPTLSFKDKQGIIDKTLKSASTSIKNFFYVLIKNQRIDIYDKIFSSFEDLYMNKENIVLVECFTKENLTKEENSKLKKDLETKLKKKIILVEVIDETIVGGIRLNYNGESVDSTYNTQLQRLKSFL